MSISPLLKANAYTLFCNKLDANDLEVSEINVDNLTADIITATTSIEAPDITATTSITTPLVTADDVTVSGTITVASAPPVAANSDGDAGTITWDATHLYVCIADGTWVRAAIATWP